MMKYEIHYSLYGCRNIIYFKEFFHTTNWSYIMYKEFADDFKILCVYDLEYERNKKNGK
jgi:hypothetical protein